MQSIGNPNNRAAIFNGQLPPIGNPAVAGRIALARAMQQNPVQVGPQGPQAENFPNGNSSAPPSPPPLTPYNPKTIGALQAPQTGPVQHPLEALARALMPVAGNYQQGQNMVAERGQKEAQMLALGQAMDAARGGDYAGALKTPNLTPEMAAVFAGEGIKPPEKVADYTIGNQRFSGTTNQVLATGAPEPPKADEVKRDVGTETWTVARDGRGSESLISASPRWQPAEPPKAEQRRIITENGINYYADTGERALPNAPAAAASPDDARADNTQYTSTANQLRDEFAAGSKDFVAVRDAYRNIQSAATNPSGPGDIALVTAYMKLLDPSTGVKEGEFATAENSAGLSAQIRNIINSAKTGQRLTPDQRAAFLSHAQNIMRNYMRSEEHLTRQYGDQASYKNINPADVLVDYTGNLLENLDRPIAPPKRGEVVDGYIFLGGDPALEESYRKVKR